MKSMFFRLLELDRNVLVYLKQRPGKMHVSLSDLAYIVTTRSPSLSLDAKKHKQTIADLKLYFSMNPGSFQVNGSFDYPGVQFLKDPSLSEETFPLVSSVDKQPETRDCLDTLQVACDLSEEKNERPEFYRGLLRVYAMDLIGDSPMGLEQSAAASREATRRVAIAQSNPTDDDEEENTTSWE